ncbi:hypothetical protein [Streptosporangium sp. NPDC001681]|uniref:hypothetical protein n=1 Tax=Streptosporangium sp. NPDC001681 TaxID=3154395 RepID=UPI003322BF01
MSAQLRGQWRLRSGGDERAAAIGQGGAPAADACRAVQLQRQRTQIRLGGVGGQVRRPGGEVGAQVLQGVGLGASTIAVRP